MSPPRARCPPQGATQRAGRGKSFSLGRRWEWTDIAAGGASDEAGSATAGVMRGGDRCSGGVARSLTIRFVCGKTEALDRVQETSTCAYATTLATPAAC